MADGKTVFHSPNLESDLNSCASDKGRTVTVTVTIVKIRFFVFWCGWFRIFVVEFKITVITISFGLPAPAPATTTTPGGGTGYFVTGPAATTVAPSRRNIVQQILKRERAMFRN